LTGNQSLDTSPAFVQFDLMTRLFSPYQLNPFNINPLRSILSDMVDFDAIRNAHCPIKLFLSATNVRTGKIRVLATTRSDPRLFWPRLLYRFCSRQSKSTVSIIGMVGIWATRQSFPLIYNCDSRDVVIVHINPIERPDVPKTAGEILNRINEISFNSSLMREMRSVCFVTKLI
jgi:NTE family protein